MIRPVLSAAWQFIRGPAPHNGTARATLVSPAHSATADATAIRCRREPDEMRRRELPQLRGSMVVLRSIMIPPAFVVLATALAPAEALGDRPASRRCSIRDITAQVSRLDHHAQV